MAERGIQSLAAASSPRAHSRSSSARTGGSNVFDGVTVDDKTPVVNGRGHYSSRSGGGHIYYVPARKYWVFRQRCKPRETTCALYIRTGAEHWR